MENQTALISVQGVEFEVSATSEIARQDFDHLISELQNQLSSLSVEHIEMLRDELLILSVLDRAITLDDISDAILLKSLTGTPIAIRAIDPVLPR
jgi:hypothetical protein